MHPADSSQYNVAVICCNKCLPIAAGNWISKAIEKRKEFNSGSKQLLALWAKEQ